jgi:hypothetical protein
MVKIIFMSLYVILVKRDAIKAALSELVSKSKAYFIVICYILGVCVGLLVSATK